MKFPIRYILFILIIFVFALLKAEHTIINTIQWFLVFYALVLMLIQFIQSLQKPLLTPDLLFFIGFIMLLQLNYATRFTNETFSLLRLLSNVFLVKFFLKKILLREFKQIMPPYYDKNNKVNLAFLMFSLAIYCMAIFIKQDFTFTKEQALNYLKPFFLTVLLFDNDYLRVTMTKLKAMLSRYHIFCIDPLIHKINQIKTVVFQKDKIISDGNYEIMAINKRKTSTVMKVKNELSQLLPVWKNPVYSTLLKNHKINDRIQCTIASNSEEKLVCHGQYEVFKILIPEDSKKSTVNYSFQYFKNDLLQANILVSDNIITENIPTVLKLNNLGLNTALILRSQAGSAHNYDAFNFDKTYHVTGTRGVKNLLNKLGKKGMTLQVTSDSEITSKYCVNCLINTAIEPEKGFQMVTSHIHNILYLFSVKNRLNSINNGLLLFVILYNSLLLILLWSGCHFVPLLMLTQLVHLLLLTLIKYKFLIFKK